MSRTNYRAPALERGLSVLELLGSSSQPMKLSEISSRLDFSSSELFRIIKVLEGLEYIEATAKKDGFTLSNKLALIGAIRPSTKSLIEIALPVMRILSDQIEQSCLLAIRSRNNILVIARIEPAVGLVASVSIGHSIPLIQSVSGAVLFGHQPKALQNIMLKALKRDHTVAQISAFIKSSEKAVELGVAINSSKYVASVTDFSSAILKNGVAVAALTIPFLKRTDRVIEKDEIARALCASANEISETLRHGGGDNF
jgi:DNA-binding IclR family transcriptional regulator